MKTAKNTENVSQMTEEEFDRFLKAKAQEEMAAGTVPPELHERLNDLVSSLVKDSGDPSTSSSD